jgi:beta-1,2-mannobiose phosphorylase / 1,2-beta-oligomannan phosphorylase
MTLLGVQVRRLAEVPVVDHGVVPGYGPIFNAGLFVHEGRYHLFARGIRDGYSINTGPGPRFNDYISDILVFTSDDGLIYEFGYVLAEADVNGIWSYEDPRVQLVDSDGGQHIVMTYTRLPAPDSGQPWQIGANLLSFDGVRFHVDHASARRLGPAQLANKDALVFNLADGRVALMHRIHPDVQVAMFDTLAQLWDADDAYWNEHIADLQAHTIIMPTPGALGVGAGAPLIVTEHGLLMFFHERNAAGVYTMNVALLDSQTAKVKAMLPDALMVPELLWEREGDVDNVVFVQGAHRRDDGTIYLTYGAADRCVGAATVNESELLGALLLAV